MGYLIIEEDLRYGYGLGDYLFDLGSDISFLGGHYLNLQLTKPLQFEIDCPKDEHPGHYFDSAIPVISKAMIDVLKRAGIDNFQIFPAVLVNKNNNLQWTDYFAFNAIGLIDAANMEKSNGGMLMSGTDYEGMPELIDFDELVIDPTKIKGAFMFRELRSPDVLVFDDKIIKFLKKYRPVEGWGLKIRKLDSAAS